MAGSLLDRAKGLLGLGGRPAAEEKPGTPAGAAVKKPPAAHHAVSIVPGSRCCAAVHALEGRRFLSKDAPVLPLRQCNSSDCTCRYQHHDDRRVGPRRARELSVAVDGWAEEDRRSERRGRRKKDDPGSDPS